MPETFEEFKDSFSYGSRSDLNFKFLKGDADDGAAAAIRDMFEETGRLLDSGDPGPLIAAFVRAQADAYRSRPLADRYRYGDAPFTRLPGPVAESSVVLLTSSGHFVSGDDPEPLGVADMTQQEAERRIDEFLRTSPQLSQIPVDTPGEDLEVRHGGYDVSGAVADHQVVLPIGHLRDLESDGVIGGLQPEAYSFVGAAAQGRIVKHSGPEWAERLLRSGADAALLVPV